MTLRQMVVPNVLVHYLSRENFPELRAWTATAPAVEHLRFPDILAFGFEIASPP
jgi:hypothetical protein